MERTKKKSMANGKESLKRKFTHCPDIKVSMRSFKRERTKKSRDKVPETKFDYLNYTKNAKNLSINKKRLSLGNNDHHMQKTLEWAKKINKSSKVQDRSMFLNKTSEKVLDHFRHQENKHQLKTKDSMANTQTLVKKNHTLLTERKMSAKHSPMKAKPENIRKKDKMSSKRGKKNPTVSHKTALTYKTSKAIYEGKMSCTIAERLRSMDLNKPTLKAKQHEGLQTFMAEDSAPI